MTVAGTSAYAGRTDLPGRVRAALDAALEAGFDNSCLPEQGALLRTLAAGVGPGLIGETGTGVGVGLAWLASGAHPAARLISIERDPSWAVAAAEVFADDPRVTVRAGEGRSLVEYGPFDLLVLDGGGHGKAGGEPVEPRRWLRPGGLLVIDDFTPMAGWPPTHHGRPDTERLYWLDHPDLRAAEIRVTPASATIVATYVGTP
ncbi:class I SAM-dependent methyltransferase [Luedemannella flava]|uniref:Class I SAM-dependent methyltransferase n=1 Tax=Luedemannella flava TaxID=349316 RepID=A0ABN2MNV7_9ACTN